ncbi:chorismate synthase, partial [Pasteurella multocida]|uniref:chorismate synthase n=1 Tax=Pasteurella multocida TaxID=747 RepID=UPI0014616711
RVAAGAIAKKYLREHLGVEVRGFLAQFGAVAIAPQVIEQIDWQQVNSNPFSCPDPSAVEKLDELIRQLQKEGDTIGAKLTVVAENEPVGLRESVFDRIDTDLDNAVMGFKSVKAAESGNSLGVSNKRGSYNPDYI